MRWKNQKKINQQNTNNYLMNKFIETEYKGRILFQSFLNEVIQPEWQQETTNQFDPVDYYFSKENVKAVVEIKVRNIKYQYYPTHYLEYYKYQNIINKKNINNCNIALYCNFFGNNTLYIYNLKHLEDSSIQSNYSFCPKTSAGDKSLVQKEIIELNTKLASVFIRQNGIWILDRKAEIN